MPKRLSTPLIAVASLLFTYLFFAEYLSPFRKVYVTFDLWGYHYPLMDHGFQSLRRLSFPAWDSSIYCGQPYAANIQAALFYPATWILYALNAGHRYLPYRSLEGFVFAHIWLAFLLAFCWLRNKRLSDLACILGAGIFAYSGYAMLQLQHQGLLCGYSWLPLGLWGIDDLTNHRNWRGFLKVAGCSAASFLAGYPPTWLVLAIYLGVYAIFTGKLNVVLRTASALLASLALSAVQLLPSIEASSLMLKENRYGEVLRDPWFYLSYVVPNFYDFGINVPTMTHFGREYLYLGAPAVFGFAAFLVYRPWRLIVPLIACAAMCLIFLTNPFELVSAALNKVQILSQVCGAWYFLAGLTATAAGVAAVGLDRFLASPATRPLSKIWTIIAVLSSAGWAIYELRGWLPQAPAFRAGWWSLLDALATLIVFAVGIFVFRQQSGRGRLTMAFVVILSAAIDYKAFGTSKRFNAAKGSLPHEYARDGFWGMGPLAFQELVAHRQYRILLDDAAPMPAELRHHGLSTPQGSDPFVTQRYLSFVKNLRAITKSNREFSFDSDNALALDTLSVRYVITTRNGPLYAHLEGNPVFKRIGPDAYYFHVFEYQKFTELSETWTPEVRRFQVNSPGSEEFVFKEQFFPGWTAYLDGAATPIALWHGDLQSVRVPPGDHQLEFRYQPRMLRIGAWISIASVVLLAAASLILRRA
jgi:hypothetical protein